MKVSLPVLLTVLFVGLKLGKVITWSWLWVVSPIWIAIALWIVVMLVICLVVLIGIAFRD